MNGFVELKVSELEGAALDWAVGEVLVASGEMTRDPMAIGLPYLSGRFVFGAGKETHLTLKDGSKHIEHGCGSPWDPSSDWGQGGTLRDKYDVGIEHGVPDGIPYAYFPGRYLDGSRGETALIALCRAIVSAKLGDVVQVPTELAEVHR